MAADNAGIPVSPPATTPDRSGPIVRWQGHPSPVPWIGRLEADPGYVYRVIPREGEPEEGLCHTCVIEVMYRHRCFCVPKWEPLDERVCYCEWCDKRIR